MLYPKPLSKLQLVSINQRRWPGMGSRDLGCGWCSGESACFPPMCSRFDFPTQCHMCVMGFDVDSLLCSEKFFPRYRFSPLLKNRDFQIQIWSCNAWGFLNEFLWIPWCSMGKQITFNYLCYRWTTTSFSSSLSKETCGHFFKQSSYNCSITNHSMCQWWQLLQTAKWAWTQSRSAIVFFVGFQPMEIFCFFEKLGIHFFQRCLLPLYCSWFSPPSLP